MDLLTRQRGELDARLAPLREQATNLELADAALAGVDAAALAQARDALGLDRGPLRTPPKATRRRPAKVAAPGSRQAQVLAVVKDNPDGIEASKIAAQVGINGTHVYGPLRKLLALKQVAKSGKLWRPVAEG